MSRGAPQRNIQPGTQYTAQSGLSSGKPSAYSPARNVFFILPSGNYVACKTKVRIEGEDGRWRELEELPGTGANACFSTSIDNLKRVEVGNRLYEVGKINPGVRRVDVSLVVPSNKSPVGGDDLSGFWWFVGAIVVIGGWLLLRRGRKTPGQVPEKPIRRREPQRPPRKEVPKIVARHLQDWREGYEETGRMAEGGFGQAYAVRLRGTRGGGEFVVKELLGTWMGGPWQENAVWVRQMEWECDILDVLGRFGYRHSPRVVERGGQLADAGGTAWYVMTMARGIPLKDWMRGLPAPSPHPGELHRRLSVIYALARAIAELHKLGVAHRDLKPENIFVDIQRSAFGGSQYGICLIDFGSSKAHGPGFEMPSGYSVLSPYHYAPEQKQDFNRSGRAADDYVLGILSYEILVGTKPFGMKQNHAEVDRKELAERLSRNGHVSYAVASFIAMNLLNMNPGQRGTAQQMQQVLESTYPNCRGGG